MGYWKHMGVPSLLGESDAKEVPLHGKAGRVNTF